ncbi:MAG: RES family NAD+ phosphorylase [Bacteroidota bacterium]
MFVYRISKKEYINDLSGIGAGLHGGRWNPKGLNLVYTSGSIALASLEFMVHNYHLLKTTTVCLAKIKIASNTQVTAYPLKNLPADWNGPLGNQGITQSVGKEFYLKGKEYVLKVPSAIIPGEFNYLLNPQHQEHKQTEVVNVINPFVFDQRLIDLCTDI